MCPNDFLTKPVSYRYSLHVVKHRIIIYRSNETCIKHAFHTTNFPIIVYNATENKCPSDNIETFYTWNVNEINNGR